LTQTIFQKRVTWLTVQALHGIELVARQQMRLARCDGERLVAALCEALRLSWSNRRGPRTAPRQVSEITKRTAEVCLCGMPENAGRRVDLGASWV